VKVVAGGGEPLRPAQRAVGTLLGLEPVKMKSPIKEVVNGVEVPWHAEETAMIQAIEAGLEPKILVTAGQDICPGCESFLRDLGGVFLSPRIVVFPKWFRGR
jgi:hypothetical protein